MSLKNNRQFIAFIGVGVSSIIYMLSFWIVTKYFAGQYIEITGRLIHDNTDINNALLHFVAQCCVWGGLGGTAHTSKILISSNDTFPDSSNIVCFIRGFTRPMMGLVAGGITGTTIGGIVFITGGHSSLASWHLLILGCSGIAGYSEAFLTGIIDTVESKLNKLLS